MLLRHALVLAVVLWGATGTASATPWADALFDTLSHDFGTTPYGPPVSHVFAITNNTGQRLHMSPARVSCGCLSATVTQRELAPGQEAALVVNVDTRRFTGPLTKYVYVQFDQPQFAEVRIVIQVNIRTDVTLTPASLAFGQVAPGTEAKANVTLTIGDPGSSVTDVKCESSYIQPRVNLVSREGGASYQVTAQLRPNVPAGSWYSTVWVSTSNPAMPRLSIPVTVEVKAPKTGS
jgi:hypothetical protein